ncbi:MAG: hypothetical protein LBH42_07195 [Treponema sp.]|nr:hypothetical protein [Treponema sp.]
MSNSLGGVPVVVGAGYVAGIGGNGTPNNPVYSHAVASAGTVNTGGDTSGGSEVFTFGDVDTGGGDVFVQTVAGSDPSSGSAPIGTITDHTTTDTGGGTDVPGGPGVSGPGGPGAGGGGGGGSVDIGIDYQ